MRFRDLNWMQLEAYLDRDDRVVLPIASTEQHAYLSLETDNILGQRVAEEAAEPLGVPVLPVLAYGVTPAFAAFPGSPSLRLETLGRVLGDILDSLHGQGFRRFVVLNAHGGNIPAGAFVREWALAHPDAQAIFHSWWSGPKVTAVANAIDETYSHANWGEDFPWTRSQVSKRLPSRNRCCSRRTIGSRPRSACESSSATVRSVAPTVARTRTCCGSGRREWRRSATCSRTPGALNLDRAPTSRPRGR